MSRNAYGSFPQWDRPHRSLRTWQKVIYILLLPVLLFYELVSGSPVAFAAMMPPTGAAAANPNPTLSAPAAAAKAIPHTLVGKLVSSTPPKQAVGQVIDPRIAAPVDALLTTSAQTIVSKDGHLSVDVPAGAITTQQITSAGGAIHLKIVQLSSTSGGQASGNLMLGSYQLQLLSVLGKPLTTLVLAQPLTLRYHLNASQQTQIWQGQEIDALWQNTSASLSSSPLAPNASSSSSTSTHVPLRLPTKQDAGQPSWSVSTRLQDPSASQKSAIGTVTPSATASPSATLSPAASSSIVTFNTVTPQASFGKAQNTDVGLNSGSLDYSSPLSVPAGPGGLSPSLNLSYSSGSVDENTNVQAAAPWVGEGWNLGLGSISWSQLDVNPSANTLDNVWTISDPSGISGQLIPPNIGDTTAGTSPVPALSSLPIVWHSAPESHSKIEEIQGGSQPCWQVWLPSGTMEEFGCTSDARQSALDAKNASSPYLWDLDAVVDRFGNQIRVHYQRISVSNGVQDAVISDIEYDDPNCHLLPTGTAILGTCSSWNPQVKIIFDSSTKVTTLTNSDGCASWSSTTFRCDDPVSVSGGIAAPKAVNSYVLNDVKVESQGNTLREYAFSYDQGIHQQVQDPATGEQKSVAGYLNLTKIQQLGTDGTPLNAPSTTMTYTKQTEHYQDISYTATPTTNCGPSWTAKNSSGACYLWAQTYSNYYIHTLDNGQGWNETITWKEARNNTYGVYVPSGTTVDVLNPFSCDGQEANYPCNEADYRAWSRMVVSARTAVTNGVSSTWSYQYKISTLGTNDTVCLTQSVCGQGFTWGDINDNDYADYYNTQFISFAQTQVTQPDGTYQLHAFDATPGLGLATSSIKCYYIFTDTSGNKTPHCGVAPYWNTNPGLGGQETEVQNFSSTGQLMQDTRLTYALNCPPPGVAGSAGAAGGIYDPGTGYLFSELDGDNPVVVCDPRETQEDDYQVDGVATVSNFTSNASVLHKTTTMTYDGDNQGSSHISGYDYGNVNKVDTTGNDVNGSHYIASTTYYPNDASSVYLTDLPGLTTTIDGAGVHYGCHVNFYGGSSSYTTSPTLPDVTRTEDHTGYSDPSNGCLAPGSLLVNQAGYDASGNPITTIDGDAHLGCTSGSSTYSACAVYDGVGTHIVSATNAKNQTATNMYNPTADGGYNQWLMATKDANGQSTTYQYDALGRLTAVAEPGDTLTSPTVTYTYNTTCTVGSTDPCMELDTTTRETIGGSQTLTTQQWFDGQGRVVETKTPGPNLLSKVPKVPSTLVTYTIYDTMGRATTTSLAYAVSALTGTGYITPDLTQPRTVTSYDALGRPVSKVTYSDANTVTLSSSLSYTVALGLPSFTQNTALPFERTTTQDAYHHQSVSYTDAIGRQRYTQDFSGTGTYTVVRTVRYDRDVVGNLYATLTYDNTTTLLSYQNATYDGVGRKTGMNDADAGSCSSTPIPAGCSSSSDTAWKYSYDHESNLLSQTDPRGVSTYMSYDALNRVLCKGTTSASVNPCGSSAYATYFYDSYDTSSNTGVSFPSGCVAPSGTSASDPIGKETAETFSASVGSGWRCAGYDQRGEVDQSGLSVTADGTTTTQSVEQSYNDIGQPTTLTYPDGEAVTDQYDSNDYYRSTYFGTPSSTGSVNFLVGQATYTNMGEVSGLALGGSAAITAQPTPVFSMAETYDSIGRAISTSATRNGSTIWNQSKIYDNVGNTLSLTTTLPTTSGGTQTDSQSFCYDSLDRLVWAGNTGTPSGGDHCGATPSGSTTTAYQQSFSYDALDRLISGPAGTETYGTTPTHGATTLSTVPNQYASYDAMGDMTCRNVDTTVGSTQACDASQTGALMSYDNEGRLSSWTAPGASTATPSDQFLYDNSGNRVLQRIDNGTGSPTDTISFDGYTDVTINGGQTSTTKYYSAGGKTVALRKDGVLSYLVPDLLGSVSLTLYADGSTESVQLYGPFGATRYSDGSTPTVYGFTGQRTDSTTGLMYYGARYYDPVSGRFISVDSLVSNTTGDDPYAYVGGNPETDTDPTGHMRIDQQGDRSWTSPIGNKATYVDNDYNPGPPIIIGYGWGSSWVPVYGPVLQLPEPSRPAARASAPKKAAPKKAAPKKAAPKKASAPAHADPWKTVQDSAATDMAAIELLLSIPEAVDEEDPDVIETSAENFSADWETEWADAYGGGTCSFVASTLVATAMGEVGIGTIKPGNQVWAYNQQTKKMELEVVRHLWINHDNDLVDLTLTTKTPASKGKPAHQSSETVHTNKKHPFLTVEKGFLPVAQLKLGMHIVESGNRTGVVTGWKSVSGAQTMYNLEVTQDHTFTVGTEQWVVHNCDGDGNPDPNELSQSYRVQNSNKTVGKSIDPNGFVAPRTERPYVNSPATTWLYDNIMKGGEPVSDQILENGSRWNVPGFLNGKDGIWELVINHDNNQVVHFLFNSHPR